MDFSENVEETVFNIKRIDVVNFPSFEQGSDEERKGTFGVNLRVKFNDATKKSLILEVKYTHEDAKTPFEVNIIFSYAISFKVPIEKPPSPDEIISLLDTQLKTDLDDRIIALNQLISSDLPPVTEILQKSMREKNVKH